MNADALLQAMLLERLGGGGDSPPFEEAMRGLAESDPRLALLARMMAAREGAVPSPAAGDEDEEQDRAAELQRAKVGELRLRRLCRRIFEELEMLRARNDRHAAAFGACHLCWGEDPECPQCSGEGEPGWIRPAGGLLKPLLRPALHRLREQELGGPSAGSGSRPPPPAATMDMPEERSDGRHL